MFLDVTARVVCSSRILDFSKDFRSSSYSVDPSGCFYRVEVVKGADVSEEFN